MSCKCKDNYDANKRHEEICKSIHEDIYIPKNEAYGDSFHKLYEDLGIISAVTQITHKYNRLKNLFEAGNELHSSLKKIVNLKNSEMQLSMKVNI